MDADRDSARHFEAVNAECRRTSRSHGERCARRGEAGGVGRLMPPGICEAEPGDRRYTYVLRCLTLLFALRVAAQAVQRWSPVDGLAPFSEFQGSALPYSLLLAIQLLLLALMIAAIVDVEGGPHRRKPRAARVLRWIGCVYMAGSVGRIAVGLTFPDPPVWFTAWIPAIFHVILALFVLTLAAYHATQPLRSGEA